MTASFNKSTTSQEWMDMQKRYMESLINAQNTFANNSMNNKYPFGNYQRRTDDMFQQWQAGMMGGGMNNPNFAADMFQQQFSNAGREFMDSMNRFNGSGQMKTPDQLAMEWGAKMHDMLGEIMNSNGCPLNSFDPLDFLASIPGLGASREKQEMLAELYKRWSYFQQVSFVYYQGMAKIGMEANMAWSDYLINPPEDAEPLETPREIFNMWVRISEKVYSKYAASEEYMNAYGNMINAYSAYKSQLNKVADSVMDQFNLPTRTELDSVHKYVTQLKKDNAAMKKELKEIKAALGLKKKAPAKEAAKKTVAAKATTAKKTNTTAKKGKK